MPTRKLLEKKEKNEFGLRFERVSFSWPCGKKAIEKCSFSIPGPGLWMIVGENGSGKSTLFKLISGLIKPQQGYIFCGLKPALVFQNPDHQILLPTCNSDLLLNLPFSLSIAERKLKIKSCLETVGLRDMESRPVHTLSGGQKQRLALAGALASEASLLLLDEPTALLDPISQQNVLETVKYLCHQPQTPLTALWITHRLEELDQADGAILMKNGRLSAWNSGLELKDRINPLHPGRVER